jgi:uracil-DNA glycosylase family 4
MAPDDEWQELLTLARRALQCQADLGHRDIIFEMLSEHKSERQPSATVGAPSITPPAGQMSLLATDEAGPGAPAFASLEEHCRAVCGCTKCSLGQTRTKFVYGVGNPHAGLMFVGEAPGFEEDRRGEPFVGRAGKLLDDILKAMNFSRLDVYIANILKCRPPENRDPQPDEMRTCLPYLEEQIRLIQPKLLCCLGRIAAHGLLETTIPLGRLRGKWHTYRGVPLLVTYHPAALLRFPQYKRDTWEDMKLIMTEYERLIK